MGQFGSWEREGAILASLMGHPASWLVLLPLRRGTEIFLLGLLAAAYRMHVGSWTWGSLLMRVSETVVKGVSLPTTTLSSRKVRLFFRSGGGCGAAPLPLPPPAFHPAPTPLHFLSQLRSWNSGWPVDVTQRWYILLLGSTTRGFLMTSGMGRKQ